MKIDLEGRGRVSAYNLLLSICVGLRHSCPSGLYSSPPTYSRNSLAAAKTRHNSPLGEAALPQMVQTGVENPLHNDPPQLPQDPFTSIQKILPMHRKKIEWNKISDTFGYRHES